MAEIRQDVNTLKMDVAHIQQEVQDLNTRVIRMLTIFIFIFILFYYKYIRIESEILITIIDLLLVLERLTITEPKDTEKIIEASDVEKCLEQCMNAIKNIDTTYNEALNNVTQRMATLETEIGHLFKKVDSIQEISKVDDVSINKLIAKVQGFETDMEKTEQAMDRILDDKEKQDTHVNV